jgi:hypothetical protein
VDAATGGFSAAAAAARAAGAALAAAAKPPLDGAAAARSKEILGKEKAAAPSALARSRSVSINDGGARKRRPGGDEESGGSGEDVDSEGEPSARAPSQPRTRGVGKRAKQQQVCGVTPETRLREMRVNGKSIREEGFERDANDLKLLWCGPCAKSCTTKTDRIKDHIASESHKAAMERAARKKARLEHIDKALAVAVHGNQVATGAHADSGGVSEAVVRYRLSTLKGWLESGCNLEQLGIFRPTMEEHAKKPLTSPPHMGELIPILRSALLAELRAWLVGKHVQLGLDGASREGECFGLTARTINPLTFVPETRLIALRCYESSFSGVQLAGVLNSITHELSIAQGDVISTSRDRAAYGRVAIEAMKIFWVNSIDMECLPHTFSHVGEHMTHASLTEFHQCLSYMWSTSSKAKVLWEERLGQRPLTSCTTRWWSWWQMMNYVMQRWGDIDGYLRDLRDNDFCKETVKKLERLLNGWTEEKRGDTTANPPVPAQRIEHKPMRHSIMLELAAVVDWGQQFVEVTSLLESDGLVVVDVFDMLLRLEYAISMPVWTNVRAVSSAFATKAIPRDAPNAAVLLAKRLDKDLKHVAAVVKPAADYFKSHFGNIAQCDGTGAEMSKLTLLFKCVRIVDPFQAVKLFRDGDTATDGEMGLGLVDNLRAVFPLLALDSARVDALKRELPTYLVRAGYARLESGVDAATKSAQLAAWWAEEAKVLPAWSSLAADVFLIVPSSCAVERVFSILRTTFNDKQTTALEDYVETSVMLQYNRRPGAG